MKKLRRIFSIIFFVLPRFSAAYPFYLAPSILSIKPDTKKLSRLLLFIIVCIVSCLISSFNAHVSITAFALSVFLQIPFLLFLFQFDVAEEIDAAFVVRVINVLTLIFSIYNMMLLGFPFKLPYKDYLPDRYSALYAEGGAKIVTIIGFFGFASEFFRAKEKKNKKFIIISLLNFVVPNYLIGMLMGLAALTIVSVRKAVLIPIILLVGLVVAPYVLQRFELINNSFAQTTGYNPKVFAYISVGQLYASHPICIFGGTGLGQFTSTPALWASEYISALSTHDIPNLWGLSMSSYHKEILGTVLSTLSSDSWALSSSASKPYCSITTIFSEYGIILSLVIFFLYFNAFKAMEFKKKYTLSIFLFVLFLFATDLWHDNMWLGYLLILSRGISKEAV